MSEPLEIQEQYWEHIEDHTILAIEADVERSFVDYSDAASFWSIKFHVNGHYVQFGTDADTEEITCVIAPCSQSPSSGSPLHPWLDGLVGKRFGWFWFARNSQGYRDMAVLAFADERYPGAAIEPKLMFLVEASSIHLRTIER